MNLILYVNKIGNKAAYDYNCFVFFSIFLRPSYLLQLKWEQLSRDSLVFEFTSENFRLSFCQHDSIVRRPYSFYHFAFFFTFRSESPQLIKVRVKHLKHSRKKKNCNFSKFAFLCLICSHSNFFSIFFCVFKCKFFPSIKCTSRRKIPQKLLLPLVRQLINVLLINFTFHILKRFWDIKIAAFCLIKNESSLDKQLFSLLNFQRIEIYWSSIMKRASRLVKIKQCVRVCLCS